MEAAPEAIFSTIQERMIGYFQRLIGVTLTIEEWSSSARLPIMFTHHFKFLNSSLQGREVLFVLCRFELEGFEIRKHAQKIQRFFDGIIIYVLAGGTIKVRNDLISLKIPFVIPGYQMYLPWFFIDLREAARKRGEVYLERSASLSPAAQALALKLIKSGSGESMTTAMICKWTGFSKMTVSKAMRELAVFSCVNIHAERRSNSISLSGTKTDAWLQLVEKLRSPVSKIYFIETPQEDLTGQCFMAGEQALAALSMLGDPTLETYACSKTSWARLSERYAWSDSPAQFENNCLPYRRMEVWSYDPALLSEQDMVDVASLYLSLKPEPDERIQKELESLLKHNEFTI